MPQIKPLKDPQTQGGFLIRFLDRGFWIQQSFSKTLILFESGFLIAEGFFIFILEIVSFDKVVQLSKLHIKLELLNNLLMSSLMMEMNGNGNSSVMMTLSVLLYVYFYFSNDTMFDTMCHIRPDVSTVCVGLAASMGAFLLSAGAKGKRYSLPNSRIMIHQPLGGAQGGQIDIDIQANEMLHHKANLNGYLAYHTGQSLEKINQDTDRDFFMSAKEAKEYGLIDGVIMNPFKALQPLPPPEQEGLAVAAN